MTPTVPPAATPPSGPSLRDIHLPAEPAWWPPAPGWWGLAGLLLIVLLVGAWWWRRHRRAAAQRGRILGELDRLARQHQQDGDHAALAGGLHQLLRRVARRHDPAAAQQRGDSWRQTLARMPVDAATLQQLLALEPAIYRPPSTFEHAAAIAAVRRWLRLALKPAAWKRAAKEPAHA